MRQIKLLSHQILNECPISPDFHPLLLRSKSIISNQSRLPHWKHFHIRQSNDFPIFIKHNFQIRFIDIKRSSEHLNWPPNLGHL
ncbi:hypothetical protein NEIMUCOT_05451 [Neisseria mucosa ATCC 25996]|uniref:Uncharacterized protein n=1 Tax=Neisseria mucosa (strain ATCC 25996 / DSM 4631 / NCTC 10774 / M26) TaxID=546266 RepID=D2ZXU7_NEIM2|nr:hypothetical protein NEIMUCOT_05451 [Neisseria mucosa ATCC 25996]